MCSPAAHCCAQQAERSLPGAAHLLDIFPQVLNTVPVYTISRTSGHNVYLKWLATHDQSTLWLLILTEFLHSKLFSHQKEIVL